MHRLAIISIIALLLSACTVAEGQVQNAQRPNVLYIMSDDGGATDLSIYGSPDIKTPNIDSIGRDGVMLTDFYSNGVLCSPTRAALISGQYPQRWGIETALNSTPTSPGLPALGKSLPQLLKNNGYATALIGKWHLGGVPQTWPNTHGFDYFFGFRGSHIDYYQHDRGPAQPDLFENENAIKVDGYMTDLITQHAVEFLQKNGNRPFYLEVTYNAPHWPYQPPDMPSVSRNNAAHLMPFTDDPNTRDEYRRMYEREDQGVGKILQTLQQLGLANNTLVIFTNDNGGEWLSRTTPNFNRKWTTWEGGIRVPALVRWPGHIAAGRVSHQVGVTMDWMASILAATNTSVPTDDKLDGMNVLPVLSGQTPEVERTLYWRTNAGTNGRNQKAVRNGDWKLMIDGDSMFIFNLRTDPGERNNLANLRQDVAQRLRPMLTAWEKDVDDTAAAYRAAGQPIPGGAAPAGAAGRGGRGGAAPAADDGN